jgi:GR25 family glycosyltransferase involved in LPS biosynthesis
MVDFVDVINDDLSNIKQLVDRIRYYLEPANYDKFVTQAKAHKQELHNKVKFNLQKNIMNLIASHKNIFDYDLKPNTLYCLHMIETPERLHELKKQSTLPSFEIFPAIKYNPGWMGCALSYVNLMYNAKRCGLDNITIFEDDCHFPDNFETLYKTITEALKQINYDIFAGCISDLPPDFEIKNIYEHNDIKFVEVSYMTSNVFNIYNHTSFDKIMSWDITNKDVYKNTIDRFFNSKDLKFVTTYPFYFDCVNSKSTLWNKNLYEEYNAMFKKSSDLLLEKIKTFTKETIKISS